MTLLASALGTREPVAQPGAALRWSRFLAATTAEGPGLRSALWVQGCSVHCPGCFNPQLWAEIGGTVEDTAQLAERFMTDAIGSGVEGTTLLGGEPFDQAAALGSVAETFRAAGLTVMTFSGYPLDRLEEWSARRPDIARLLGATDLLIDGPYLRDQPDAGRPWLGSTNQGIRSLTPVYAAEVARIEREGGLDRLEIRIHPDGRIDVTDGPTISPSTNYCTISVPERTGPERKRDSHERHPDSPPDRPGRGCGSLRCRAPVAASATGPSLRWRLGASAWMLLLLIGGGALSSLAFGIVAVIARRRLWGIIAGAYAVAGVAVALPEHGSCAGQGGDRRTQRTRRIRFPRRRRGFGRAPSPRDGAARP